MLANILTILAAIFAILPQIIAMVREGQIKEGSYDEVLSALADLQADRVARAIAARDAPDDGLLDDGFDRSKKGPAG